MSAIFGFNAEIWEEIYDRLLQEVPDSLSLGPQATMIRTNMLKHREIVRKIYQRIKGEWWKRGFITRLYFFENRAGKSFFELNQDLKATKLVLADLEAVNKWLKWRRFCWGDYDLTKEKDAKLLAMELTNRKVVMFERLNATKIKVWFERE